MDDEKNLIGKRIKALRTSMGKNQSEFSSLLGIPQSTLSSYESGTMKPSVDAAINIANTCNVTMDWLCGRDANNSERRYYFPSRFRQLRHNKPRTVSFDELSEELNIPKPMLIDYEQGTIRPSIDVVLKLAERFGVSVDWLCGIDNIKYIESLGDVFAFFVDLFAIDDFKIETNIEGNKIPEDKYGQRYIDILIKQDQHLTGRPIDDPECPLNTDLINVIYEAVRLNLSRDRREISDEQYERQRYLNYELDKKQPLTHKDYSNETEEERREKMYQILKREMSSESGTTD